MQALFNVAVTVTNVVVKYTAPNTVTTMTCRAIKCFTATDGWRAGLKVGDYARNACKVKGCQPDCMPDFAVPK